MNRPLVSIVIETITSRFDARGSALAEELGKTLDAVGRQTWPSERIETIVVLDDDFDPAVAADIGRRHPSVRFATSRASNYFAAKNAGAAVAAGEVIVLLDGDCVPASDWLECLVARLEPGVGAVAGRTCYDGGSLLARTFTVPDFAHVLGEDGDSATGFNINNLAFPREVFLSHPFEERIARNGGCYFLFHQLRADGIRVVYEPRARVAHGLDIQGLGFVHKHFERGRDGVTVYRLDEREVLRGTRLFRRLGPLALLLLYGRRIGADWVRLTKHRSQIGIATVALPYYFAVSGAMRIVELAGALTAMPHREVSRS